MDAATVEVMKNLRSVARAMALLPTIAAEAYANGKFGTAPIVEQHFTPGNAERNGWEPLSREYAMAKARGLTKNRRGVASDTQKLSTGRRVKIDRAVPFQSTTGTLRGIGSGANLPMLVNSGLLRERVTSRTLHRIAATGDTAVITFTGLPDYARYLQTGTGRMPKRSPVEPSYSDTLRVEAALRQYLDAVTGGSRGLPVSARTIPGAARVIG